MKPIKRAGCSTIWTLFVLRKTHEKCLRSVKSAVCNDSWYQGKQKKVLINNISQIYMCINKSYNKGKENVKALRQSNN